MSEYQLPKIWTAPQNMGGTFGRLNQPTAGARFEQHLPSGDKPFQLYSVGTPNGVKATIMLEELRELGISNAEYDAFNITIPDADQFGSDFVAINPNSKIPAMLDNSGDKAVRIFESASILLYLADKFNVLIPDSFDQRAEVMNWLIWSTGAAPFLGGGFGHFYHYAPHKIEYAIDRFSMEAKRQLDVLDKELAQKPYIAGEVYSIADIAIWSWWGQLALDHLYKGAGEFLDVTSYVHLQEWASRIAQRPAVQRGLNVTHLPIK